MSDQEPPEQERPAGGRLLRRSVDDRMILGVAGGLGRFLGIDPIAVRLAFVALTLAGGGGVILYIIAAILIPEEKEGEPVGLPPPRRDRSDAIWWFAGVGLIALGGILLLDRVFPWFDRIIGPLVLVAIGAAILIQGARR